MIGYFSCPIVKYKMVVGCNPNYESDEYNESKLTTDNRKSVRKETC